LQKLGIIVGGAGRAVYTGTTRDGDRMTSGGGGGASLVMVWHKSEVRAPIIIAAGGGGATCMYNGVNASLDTQGNGWNLYKLRTSSFISTCACILI
jgi:hypothetical protein